MMASALMGMHDLDEVDELGDCDAAALALDCDAPALALEHESTSRQPAEYFSIVRRSAAWAWVES